MKSAQPTLDLRNAHGHRLTFRLPMLGTEAVRAVTGLSEDEILVEIDLGKILWAWDLSSKKAERKFLRIWNRSLICWECPELSQPDTFEAVLPFLLPRHGTDTPLQCVELKRVFNCDSEHVLHLMEQKLFTRVVGTSSTSSTSRLSPLVTRESVVAFLESRRLT